MAGITMASIADKAKAINARVDFNASIAVRKKNSKINNDAISTRKMRSSNEKTAARLTAIEDQERRNAAYFKSEAYAEDMKAPIKDMMKPIIWGGVVSRRHYD